MPTRKPQPPRVRPRHAAAKPRAPRKPAKPATRPKTPKKDPPATKPKATKPAKATYTGKEYEATPAGLVRWRRNSDGAEGYGSMQLTNFTAQIIEDLVLDDGSGETGRAFRLLCTLDRGKRTTTINLPAKEFALMNWPTEHLGSGAIVNPNCRDHARTAIQRLSNKFLERRVFRHTGWRVIDGAHVYLHNGGGIGARGAIKGIETQLSSTLEHYTLPDPPKRPELAPAVAASLYMLDVAPDRITFPVFASIWRAILGEPNFAIHLSGHTQTGKSELTALAQQHFGARMNKQRLPGSWLSTGNALEALAFEAKDALLSVDDFKPVGNSAEQQRFHSLADRLLRAQGNSTGRQRMTAEISLRAGKRPRGMIFSSGEDVPKGQSLRARLVVIELARGDMRANMLDRCQADAAAGLYAQTTAGFIKWLAARVSQVPQLIQSELSQCRELARAKSENRLQRSPDNVFHLSAAFRIWLSFATQTKAIGKAAADKLWSRAAVAFDEAIQAQETEQKTSDPCQQFFETLVAIMGAGRGHFASTEGGPPTDNPADWGWSPEGGAGFAWGRNGEKLGWIDPSGVYVSDSAYGAVRKYVQDAGEFLELPPTTLAKRLNQHGLLLSTDRIRQTLKIRHTCEGARQNVLHVAPTSLYPPIKPDQPDQLAAAGQEPDQIIRIPRSGFQPVLRNPTTHPTNLTDLESVKSGQLVGLVGKKETLEGDPLKRIRAGRRASQKSGRVSPPVPRPINGKPDQIGQKPDQIYPRTLEVVQQMFPETDDNFMSLLRVEVGEDATDEELAAAVEFCALRDRRKQTSPGLFLTTVPKRLKVARQFAAAEVEQRAANERRMIEQGEEYDRMMEREQRRMQLVDALPADEYQRRFDRIRQEIIKAHPASQFAKLDDPIRARMGRELEEAAADETAIVQRSDATQ